MARDQDQLAVRTALDRLDEVHRYLGLVVAIGLEIFRPDPELVARDIQNRTLLRGLRNLNV